MLLSTFSFWLSGKILREDNQSTHQNKKIEQGKLLEGKQSAPSVQDEPPKSGLSGYTCFRYSHLPSQISQDCLHSMHLTKPPYGMNLDYD